MKPTEKQIKEVWFWCGLRCDNVGWYIPKGELGAVPDVYIGGLSTPVPDLNNLFKWAVPNLISVFCISFLFTDECVIEFEKNKVVAKGDTPALALFWAIYKLIEDKG